MMETTNTNSNDQIGSMTFNNNLLGSSTFNNNLHPGEIMGCHNFAPMETEINDERKNPIIRLSERH